MCCLPSGATGHGPSKSDKAYPEGTCDSRTSETLGRNLRPRTLERQVPFHSNRVSSPNGRRPVRVPKDGGSQGHRRDVRGNQGESYVSGLAWSLFPVRHTRDGPGPHPTGARGTDGRGTRYCSRSSESSTTLIADIHHGEPHGDRGPGHDRGTFPDSRT